MPAGKDAAARMAHISHSHSLSAGWLPSQCIGDQMKNIFSLIFKKSKKQEMADGFYRCWICEAAIKNNIDFLYHIHECEAVKRSGLPLQYNNESGKWEFDRKMLLDKNKTNTQQNINTT